MTAADTALRFVQVDAFADRPFAGNQAAVIPLDGWRDEALLQAIAEENNLAETAFVVACPPGDDADYELRWFTPTVEVAMCGHATLASGHVLLGDDPARDRIRFRTRQVGTLVVARGANGGYTLDLPALVSTARALPETAAAIGGVPVETFWRDGGYALYVYASAAEIRALDPDFRALKAAGDILHVCTAPGIETDIVSRVFVPGGGIDEDPVTGAAHALLTPYWTRRLGRDRFTAHQASRRGGTLACRLDGDRVLLDGRCVTVIEGTMRV